MFREHVELLRQFLAQRAEIVARIDALLSVQRTPLRPLQAHSFEDCFYSAGASHLRGQLQAAYWAAGFQPRGVSHLYNDLIDPTEILGRGVHCWRQTWWPGRGGRVHFAQTLFNVYVLRQLQFMSLRIWEEGGQIGEVQAVLDELWKGSPANQPKFVRDARWLIPLAQSLITDELGPYFEVARLIRETLPEADALEIQRAHVRMLGGHLTSQIRHFSTRDGVPIDDPSIVVRTRTTNALDLALLVQGLVALLRAYESGDERIRRSMAGAILQGISPDPELLLNRHDLLRPYTMIEYLPGHPHLDLLTEYCGLMNRLRTSLGAALPHFRPSEGTCSPYGVVFGLPSSLIEHMTLKALQQDAEVRFGLEDVFEDVDANGAKLAWVNGWRNLPHIPREVQQLYEYPHKFAEDIYNRMAREFGAGPVKAGKLHIASGESTVPARYCVSSGKEMEQAQLLRERQEGIFLVSHETPGGWTAITKDLLTEVLGTGRDIRIAGLPTEAVEVLQRMCGDLVGEK